MLAVWQAADEMEFFESGWTFDHFYPIFSDSTGPCLEGWVTTTALAQATKRLRVGLLVTGMPYRHPAVLANMAAALDVISGGRLELGLGAGWNQEEADAYGIDIGANLTERFDFFDESLQVIVGLLTNTTTDFEGRFLHLRGARCEPKPVQRPHPPVWVACSRRDTILLAAEKGIGALAFAFVDPEEARQWVADYHATMEAKGVPIGDAVNSEVACVTTFMCHEDEETALARGIAGANFFGYSLAHYYVFGRHQPGVTDVWAEYEQQRAAQGFDPEAVAAAAVNEDRLGAKIVDEGTAGLRGAVGTPVQVREYLRRYEEAGVDQVILTAQAGKNRHEHIMESLELFGREVLPEFIDREPAAAEQRRARTQRMTDRLMARKPAEDHPPLPSPDYSFPAIPRLMADRSGSDDFHAWLDAFAEQSAAGGDQMRDLIG
jgi:alkanesulfonate monooxygenase SsuD/methylene tetrahydromethanopterin reductase-like flavin-dependent oxidoreductase (luciferase family)